MILHDRELTLAQFEPARYADPTLQRFAVERVDVICDPALVASQATVEADTADGSAIAVRCEHPRGAPENPLSRRDIEDKFRAYARTRLPESRIEEAIGLVWELEKLPSARTLMDLLRSERA